ncbi:hypothetical protein [Micromonospora sp. NPDC005324]|uniref:hypothetical protein n=1 Tax=Micromonospora sp. NPDC005324 TaxID=3157033 RepID=UPI0033BC5A3F
MPERVGQCWLVTELDNSLRRLGVDLYFGSSTFPAERGASLTLRMRWSAPLVT